MHTLSYRKLEELHNVFLVDQSIQALNSISDTVLETNSEILDNMIDAVHGRITTSLFPLEDSEITSERGDKN